MQDILDHEEKPVELSDREIFLQIWIAPKKVFRFVHEREYEKYFMLLLILAGISRSFNRASSNHSGDDMSLIGVILVSVLFGGLFGWLGTYIYAAMISWTGKWLKGEGDTGSVMRILAYAGIPTAVTLLIIIPEIIILGNELFKSTVDISYFEPAYRIAFYILVGVGVVLQIWTIVLYIIGTSVVQNFSIGKAILNLLIPILMIALPLMALMLLIV